MQSRSGNQTSLKRLQVASSYDLLIFVISGLIAFCYTYRLAHLFIPGNQHSHPACLLKTCKLSDEAPVEPQESCPQRAACSLLRARARRDMTVPTGIFATPAISL